MEETVAEADWRVALSRGGVARLVSTSAVGKTTRLKLLRAVRGGTATNSEPQPEEGSVRSVWLAM